MTGQYALRYRALLILFAVKENYVNYEGSLLLSIYKQMIKLTVIIIAIYVLSIT